ncbi:MAG: GNAT family N-acetyltransferase [Provencibacterium sp.]|nr:GNAT family N-acetyltransferase [Provencibacterium sp.]
MKSSGRNPLVVGFTREHLKQAEALARAAYQEERAAVPALPPELPALELDEFAENGMGVAALDPEDGRLLGFLCGCSPFERAFRATQARGVFSPMHANAAQREGRADIYARMLPAAQERWARAGASSHAVCLYAHDRETQRLFFTYGFGLRCIDAIRSTAGGPEEPPPPGIRWKELTAEEMELAYPLILRLDDHMAASPTFIRRVSLSLEAFRKECREDDSRCFAALEGSRAAAVLLAGRGGGETVVSDRPEMWNIRGAYCLPEYRGSGLYGKLLENAVRTLHREGAGRLGVDFESINPAANRFWPKYFTPYTHSVTRRIDEDVLKELASPDK